MRDRPATIRPLTSADHAAILAMTGELREFFDEDARTRAIPLDIIHQIGFVAEAADQVVGFITLYVCEARLHIGWIATRKASRRRGVGTMLIRAAETRAAAMGIAELAVMTLGDSVDYPPYVGTRAFYAALGFRPRQRNQTDNPGCPEELHLVKKVEPAATGPAD